MIVSLAVDSHHILKLPELRRYLSPIFVIKILLSNLKANLSSSRG